MLTEDVPVPHLTTAHGGPLHYIEKVILNQVVNIETWFREKWQETPPPINSSVDLRHAGYKLAPVDTNLFPAGFNNLNPDFMPLCIQAVQSTLMDILPKCRQILVLPESHTRNLFYFQSLAVLCDILTKAGFVVRLGNLDPEQSEVVKLPLDEQRYLEVEPLIRRGKRVGLADFSPCILLLNNDLSNGVPEILMDLDQAIVPTPKIGWTSRLKSNHFYYFDQVAKEFADLVNMDPWLINPYFESFEGIDFMAQEGINHLAVKTDQLLAKIKEKYRSYNIQDKPFVVIKADNGTYGMSVMIVHEGAELTELNRKQRTRMAASKGGRKVDRLILQEGVYTFETMPEGEVAEPVVYMIGQFVVGGFYRVHHGRGKNENLNSPGMHFEPLAFAQACNMPRNDLAAVEYPNRFYTYGVIARLGALAAAREIAAIENK